MRCVAVAVIGLLVSATLVQAQTAAVRVRVLHDNTGIEGARVTLGSRSLLSNGEGAVVFQVAGGRYELRVQRVGYLTLVDTVTVHADTTISVQLQEAALEAEEIIVTSTRGERRVQDEPVKVEVVTREEVEEKLLMTPGSISMLLNETSGLRVQETSPALGGAVIRVQGLRGRYTQLLSDGLPSYGGQAGSLGILQIPPVDLAQVEVIKGAASALYGASALGGAINLISRRPADETEIMVNQTTRQGSDVILWNSDQLTASTGYTLLVSGHSQESQDVNDDGWADLPRYRRFVARPRWFLNDGRGAQAMATVGTMHESRRGGGTVPTGERFNQRMTTKRYDVGLTARWPLRNDVHLDIRGSGSTTDHEHVLGDTRERDHHRTAFSEVSLRGQSGRHYWVAGGALQRDGYNGKDIDGFDYVYWIPSVFVQDEITLSDRLIASFSARADWHNEYGAFLAPRASALLRMSDVTSLRFSAGRGYFGPTPFTEETEEVGLSRVRIPTALRAEIADVFSADLNWNLSTVETNVSVFASRVQDAVQAVEHESELHLINVPGNTRTQGAEALARFRREPFGLTAAYTFIHATQPAIDSGRENAPLVPRHSASLIAMYEVHEAGRVGLEMYYTGSQALDDDPLRERSEPYLLLGVLVERRFGRVRAFVNMENLTNVRQSNYGPTLRPARAPAGRWTTDVWAPLDGRTFNAGVRVTIR